MSNSLVTVIAVCYNQHEYVEAALNSIISQTYKPIQLIVADDGSTDGSKVVIQKWINDYNNDVIFVNNKTNLGLTKNINTALPFVKGEFFQVFGCDDIMLPQKIEQQVILLEQNKDAAIAYSDMFFINDKGEQLSQTYYEKHAYKKPSSGWLYHDLIERFIISAPSVLIRKTVLDQLKKYNEHLDYEDQDFFLRASKNFHFIYSPEKTVSYRISANSLTGSSTILKFMRNSFLIYLDNYDFNKEYQNKFDKKLIFYAKNLYAQKFKYAAQYFLNAFFKTHKIIFLKYTVAALPFYFSGIKK